MGEADERRGADGPPRGREQGPARGALHGVRLVIDPGAGEPEAAGSPSGQVEAAQWALAAALALAAACAPRGAAVLLTRETERPVPRVVRLGLAREAGANLVLGLRLGTVGAPAAAAARFWAPWWQRRRAEALIADLVAALGAAMPLWRLPWSRRAASGRALGAGPRALALLLVAHPPTGAASATACDPAVWGRALAAGLAAHFGAEVPAPREAEPAAAAPPPASAPPEAVATPPPAPRPARPRREGLLVPGVRLPVGGAPLQPTGRFPALLLPPRPAPQGREPSP